LFGKRVKWASSSLSLLSLWRARAINEEERARERKTILFDIISLVCAAAACKREYVEWQIKKVSL
jgi:hypothetical protein